MREGTSLPEDDDGVIGAPPSGAGQWGPSTRGAPSRASSPTRDDPVPPPPAGYHDARVDDAGSDHPYVAPPAPERRGLATAALVLAILTGSLSLLGPFAFIAWVIGVPSLVVAILAVAMRAQPRGVALSALIITIVAGGVSVAMMAAFLSVFDEDGFFGPPELDFPNDDDFPAVVPSEPAAQGPIGDGVWVVGGVLEAGTYRVTAPLVFDEIWDSCFWSTYSDYDLGYEGAIESQLASGGIPTVTLVAGTTFESDGCGMWAQVDPSSLFDSADGASIVAQGEWLVGEDIAPGVYRTQGPLVPGADGFVWCSWNIYDGTGATYEGQLQYGAPRGGIPTVELTVGTTFSSSECGTWEAVDPATLFDNSRAPSTMDQGVWLVGEDVPPGTYGMVEGTQPEDDFCYWTVLSTYGGDYGAYVSSGGFDAESTTVTLETGQQFESSGCGTWELAGR